MIINFISGKDLGGPKQSFVLYTEVLQKIYTPIHSVIRKGAQLKQVMQSQGLSSTEVNYLRIPFWPFNTYAIKKIKQQLQPLNAKVILVHKALDLKIISQALPNIKIIGVIHSFHAPHIKYADALIAVSQKVKDFLIKQNYKKPIYLIPNMIKLAPPPPLEKSLQAIPVIGAMGVFRRTKGFHTLIKSLNILKQNSTPFKAIIAGKGKLYYYLKFLKWKYSLKNHLTIKPWISNNERNAFLDSLDLYILPSKSETFGMVIIEAMARKKRVIATKCGGPEEIITDKHDGYLVPKQDSLALAKKIEMLIKNPDYSEHIPTNAYQTAQNKYSAERVSKTLQDLLNTFL